MTDVFVADFETTVFEGQENTEVWASASVQIGTEDVKIFHSIDEQFRYFKSLNRNIIVYYHNLKFDGSFWLSYLMLDLNFKQASDKIGELEYEVKFQKNKEMKNNSFKYVISDMGQWYSITIKVNNHLIEIRDSLKLLPFSVRQIGQSFGTKHKKLDMEYKGFRYAGCVITDEEKEYIANDVLVVKEALEIMFQQGHDKLTIGSCCLSEYKKIVSKSITLDMEWDELFPDVTEIPIDESLYRYKTADEYIRKSYKGGWCYVVRGKENIRFGKGITADVNSLYPSMMHSKSGNKYPVGNPHFWKGDYIPQEAKRNNTYYFIRVKTRFYIKPDKLPCIQIKGNPLYHATDWLDSSDVYDSKNDRYCTHTVDHYGNVHDTRVELVLTMTDYQLIKDQYELIDFEILDGCWFYAKVGIFDEYIDYYAEIKKTSKGALRQLAKLFLNNLYGKMASSTSSSFKVAYLKEDESVGFYQCNAQDKKAGYIPVGSAITSYARNFTIRSAQANYHGLDEAGFIYADTDSIHCNLDASEIKGIDVDPVEFCCWKLESSWDEAIFTRQKTYIEHVVAEDLEPVENPYYNIKCAGMPQACKDLLEASMTGVYKDYDSYTEEEKEFLFKNGEPIKRDLEDFNIGLTVPDKLIPKRIKGGVLLVETTYQMR